MRNSLRTTTLLLPFIFLGSLATSWAQSLDLFEVDATLFPQIEASMIALDADGTARRDLMPSDLDLREDGVPVERTISVDCPPTGPSTPVSLVFVIDRSASMSAPMFDGISVLDMVVGGLDGFLANFDFTGGGAVAATAFNDRPYLLTGFQTTGAPVRQAIASLLPGGGTLFDPAFLDPFAGGIALLGDRPAAHRRVIVFISDGAPNQPPSVDSILRGARDAGVVIYALTVGSPTSPEVAKIALDTEGKSYDRIATASELESILRSIALLSKGVRPCRVRWISRQACDAGGNGREGVLRWLGPNVSDSARYQPPRARLATLEVEPKFLWFGKALYPATVERPVTITARNSEFTVQGDDLSDSDHFRVVDWGGIDPPFTLSENESRTITVRFSPADTSGYAAELRFDAFPCPSRSIALGGGDKLPIERAPLKLLAPLGSEVFGACDSIEILWGGVPPETPVTIEASDDDGAHWFTVARGIANYRFVWKPPHRGTAWRVRISTDAVNPHFVNTIAGGGDTVEDGVPATDVALLFPRGADIWNDTLFVAEQGRHQIRAIDLASGTITTAAGFRIAGTRGDGFRATLARLTSPSDVLIDGDTMFIADYGNHRVRAVDMKTRLITTYAGTGMSGNSGDGGSATRADINFPKGLVVDERHLYVSDEGSNVIRRIDRTTGIITTFAGGGTFYDSDGASATEALLSAPALMTVYRGGLIFTERNAGRVRRVDLATGVITTLAGNGVNGFSGDGGDARRAELNGPEDVAIHDSVLYVAEYFGNRIRTVDLRSGIISTLGGTGIGGFSGDGGLAGSALFNSPAGLAVDGDVLYLSDRINHRIRTILLRLADGLDSSRAPFTVAGPELGIADDLVAVGADAGSVPQGVFSDTTLTGALCSRGNLPTLVDSIRIEGDHAQDFAVATGASARPIAPGACADLRIEFTPSDTGRRTAIAIFFNTCSEPDTLLLTGYGTSPCTISSLDLVGFDSVVIGRSGPDTLVRRLLCNDGAGIVRGTVALSDPAGAFEIVSGGGTFALTPGTCLEVVLRFHPMSAGPVMSAIEIELESACGPVQTFLHGVGLRPQRLDADSLGLGAAPCPDEGIDSSIVIRNPGDVPLTITGATFTENDEGFTLLDPVPSAGAPLVVPQRDSAVLRFRFSPGSAGNKRAVLRLDSDDPRGSRSIALAGRRDSLRVAADQPVLLVQRSGGFPRPIVMTIRNTGDRDVTITGASPTGSDRGMLDVPASQFPIVLPAGGTVDVSGEILAPAEERTYRTDVIFSLTPACVDPASGVEVVLVGRSAELVAEGLTLPALLCENPDAIDTLLTLRNVGGDLLRITGWSVEGDPSGAFDVDLGTPLDIPPGESRTIAVRYAPTADGTTDAILVLTTNTPGGTERIPISGRRDRVDFSISRTVVDFVPGSGVIEEVVLVNTGTVDIAWNIPFVAEPFIVEHDLPASAEPGDSLVLRVRYGGTGSGEIQEMVIAEALCGETAVLTMRSQAEALSAHVRFPHKSAVSGEAMVFPMIVSLGAETGLSPTDTFTTTVSFYGATFLFESARGVTILDEAWDAATGTTRLQLKGAWKDVIGDTLLYLDGRALLAEQIATPIRIDAFAWQRPNATTTTENGSLTVTGACLDRGIRLVAAPHVEKIRPNPASDLVTAEVVLDDPSSLRWRLVDITGRTVAESKTVAYPTGRHEFSIDVDELAAGMYVLRFESPYGAAERMIVVER